MQDFIQHIQQIENTIAQYDSVEDYILATERHYTDIIPGTEKTIRWLDNERKVATRYALVYIHGFSASRQETAPLSELLAGELKANLFLTRLSGHGRGGNAMLEVSVEKLCLDAIEALSIANKLGKDVIIVANSTGATLSTWLATQTSKNIAALIHLSPNFGLRDKKSRLLQSPLKKMFLRWFLGSNYQFTPANALQEKYWTTRYPSDALIPMQTLIHEVRKCSLEKVTSPVLTLYSTRDQIVSPRNIEKYTKKLGSKINILQEFSNPESRRQHVLAGDILSPGTTLEVKQIILDFIRSLP